MYYDRLKKRVLDVTRSRRDSAASHIDITSCIADCYLPIHNEVQDGTHTIFHLPGGRGSCKSSFVSLEIVDGIMKDPAANGIVFRRYANTLRESTFSQISWAIEQLGVSHLWRGNVSPMQYTYLPTGQQIFFRGLDDAAKLKSIKPRRGTFKFVWFEEFSELTGANMVRNVLQSVVRGGTDFRIFNSFNPPISVNSWANKFILIPDERAVVFRTDYEMIPPEWLGDAFLLEAERLQAINEKAWRHDYKGDPTGTGKGGSDTKIKGEFSENGVDNDLKHVRGTVSMARKSDPDSATSQFFICYDELKSMDGKNAAFGEVTEGMDVVDGFMTVCRGYTPQKSPDDPKILSVPGTPITIVKAEMIDPDENGNHRAKFTVTY